MTHVKKAKYMLPNIIHRKIKILRLYLKIDCNAMLKVRYAQRGKQKILPKAPLEREPLLTTVDVSTVVNATTVDKAYQGK